MSLPRHERPQRLSPACLGAIAVMVVLAVSLGGVRLYSLYLEYRLSDINSKIEAQVNRRVSLEIKLASLLSPERIYVNAKARLGMEPRSTFQSIRVIYQGAMGGGQPPGVATDRISPPSILEMAGAAHAKE